MLSRVVTVKVEYLICVCFFTVDLCVIINCAIVSSSGVVSVDNWRGEYSYIRVHNP